MLDLLNTDVVCIDYETVRVNPDGTMYASPDFWYPDFRVLSCAFASELGTVYRKGEDAVGEVLRYLADRGTKIVVHNLGFEQGVTICRYPDINVNWHADTMRLAQNYDLGGKEDEFEWVTDPDEILEEGDEPTKKRYPLSGLSLVKCARRNLGDAEDHKKEAHDWIYANVPECKKGKAGQYLDRLPEDILERYTVADAVTTLRLYEFYTTQFELWEFDWTFDHMLYKSTTTQVVLAKIRGINVKRDKLSDYASKVAGEIANIEKDFRTKYAKEISEVELDRAMKYILKVKTIKGQRNRYKKYVNGDPKTVKEIRFNVGSNTQLAALFVDKLGIVPKFFTDKGSPSFKSAMLGQWGEGGELLKTRRKRMLVLTQSTSLYHLSADDGKWHLGLKVAAAASGRLAGGS